MDVENLRHLKEEDKHRYLDYVLALAREKLLHTPHESRKPSRTLKALTPEKIIGPPKIENNELQKGRDILYKILKHNKVLEDSPKATAGDSPEAMAVISHYMHANPTMNSYRDAWLFAQAALDLKARGSINEVAKEKKHGPFEWVLAAPDAF